MSKQDAAGSIRLGSESGSSEKETFHYTKSSLVKTILAKYQSVLVLVLVPIVGWFLFLRDMETSDPESVWDESTAKCAFVLFVMACYWSTQAVPLAVTSLLPIFAFPFLHIPNSKEITKTISNSYMDPIIFLFMGGLIVALAIEEYNIHKRIALFILSKMGAKPAKLMFGFMTITALLSMWISNTATTALMVPIVTAVHSQLFSSSGDNEDSEESKEDNKLMKRKDFDEAYKSLVCKALLLSVAYGANIGGIGTTIGTPTNLILLKQANYQQTLGFTSWMLFAVPLVVVCLLICWVILVWTFLGLPAVKDAFKTTDKSESSKISSVFSSQLKDMGRMGYSEKLVSIFFVCTAILWMTRKIGTKHGWGRVESWQLSQPNDSTTAMLIAFLLMVTPNKPNFFNWFFKGGRKFSKEIPDLAPPLLSWKMVQKRLAWDVIILLGGGFALAKMCSETGLSEVMGQTIGDWTKSTSPALTVLIATAGVSLTTGFTSNVSTAQIFLPILHKLANSRLGINPEDIMIPSAIACSFAFILPISTPPNAIAFSTGKLRTIDLIKAGGILNIVLVVVTWAYTFYTPVLSSVFDFGEDELKSSGLVLEGFNVTSVNGTAGV